MRLRTLFRQTLIVLALPLTSVWAGEPGEKVEPTYADPPQAAAEPAPSEPIQPSFSYDEPPAAPLCGNFGLTKCEVALRIGATIGEFGMGREIDLHGLPIADLRELFGGHALLGHDVRLLSHVHRSARTGPRNSMAGRSEPGELIRPQRAVIAAGIARIDSACGLEE